MQLIEQTYVMSHVVHLSIPPRRHVNSRAAITNFVRRVGKGGGENGGRGDWGRRVSEGGKYMHIMM